MASNELLNQVECALSIDRHFVKNPIEFKVCEHVVCQDCIPKKANSSIKCNICGMQTSVDQLINSPVSAKIKHLLKSNFANMLQILETEALNTVKKMKGMYMTKQKSLFIHIIISF